MRNLTAARLKELLTYDASTGIFVWAVKQSNNIKVGDVAGGTDGTKYLAIQIDGHKYKLHRLAWLYVYGEFPKSILDHIDGDKRNNRIENLREVTVSENAQNQRGPMSRNTTGLLGVVRARRLFQAQICVDGKRRCLGTYETAMEAHQAYLEEKRRIHPACTI